MLFSFITKFYDRRILAEALFDPLGMADTNFHVPEEKRGRLMPSLDYFPGFAEPPVSVNVLAFDATPAADPLDPSVRDGRFSTGADPLRFPQCLASKGERAGVRILSMAGFERSLFGEAWPAPEGAETGSAPRGLLFDPPWVRGGVGSCLLARFGEVFASAVLWLLTPSVNCRGYSNPWPGAPVPPWPPWARAELGAFHSRARPRREGRGRPAWA